MRLTSLFSSRESLISEGTAIATVADNLANQNTPGFKQNRTEFSDLLADSVGSLYGSEINPGNGVKPGDQRTIHQQQGTIEATGRDLDFAISGRGHFIIGSAAEPFYTRAGNFELSPDGEIVTISGENLLGFTEASPTTLVPLTTAGVVGTAAASTTGSLEGNLDASTALTQLPAGAATFREINAASSFTTPISLVDSLGTRHEISLSFFHTGPGQWTAAAYVDAGEVGGTPGTPAQIGTTTMTFDGNGAQAAAETLLNLTPAWSNGAAASNVAVNIGPLTQFSGGSALSAISVDGNGLGSLTGFDLQPDGGIFAVLDNGESVQIGTVATAIFQNTDGLDRVGNNMFQTNGEEGETMIGPPTEEGRGSVSNGGLESSTVDAAGQFVDLIRYQRAYQAGSQVISTVSELLNVTINIA